MINRKVSVLFVLILMLGFLPLTSAQPFSYTSSFMQDTMQRMVDIVTQAAAPIFDALLGDYTGGYDNFTPSEIFFIRILLLILLFVILFMVIKTIPKIGENKGIAFIIALVISVIAVRFMSKTELFFGILLPYGVMGAAITTILPFLVFFYFLHVTNVGSAGRRLCWILFGIIFVALWISKSSQMSEVSNWIYIAASAAVVLAFLFDREIHRYFALHEINIFIKKSNQRAVASLQAEYMNILSVDTPQAKARRDDIEKQLAKFGANLP